MSRNRDRDRDLWGADREIGFRATNQGDDMRRMPAPTSHEFPLSPVLSGQQAQLLHRHDGPAARSVLKAVPVESFRSDKVAKIKAAIADGTYDDDGAKLNAAIPKLFDELSKS